MSTFTHESMINHHDRGFDQPRGTLMSGGSAGSSGVSSPNCPTVTCTTSAFPGATSFSKRKAVLAGLNAAGPASPQKRDAGRRFLRSREVFR